MEKLATTDQPIHCFLCNLISLERSGGTFIVLLLVISLVINYFVVYGFYNQLLSDNPSASVGCSGGLRI